MAQAKTERLLNLLIMLLVQRTYVPKERIRAALYPGQGDEAFEKMFERDKDDLRALGVPIEVGQLDAFFDDEPGYRVRPDRFALPDVALEPDEAAVVGLATQVWEDARLAGAASDAVRKLSAAGLPVDAGALDVGLPRLSAAEPAFDAFWEATLDRVEVRFDYQRPGEPEPTRRRVRPWGVARASNRWYAVGYDLDRGAERVFRLSRVRGDVVRVGEPGSYEIPEGTDVREIARRISPPPPTGTATVLVREGAGHALRRRAEEVAEGVPGPDTTSSWDRLVVPLWETLADHVLSLGPDAVVAEPAALRQEVVARLTALVEGGVR